MKRLFLGILLLVSLLSISANEDLTAWTADRIWTANPNQPWAQVVITKGKHILAVGDKSLLNSFEGNIKHTQGALMVPGMSEAKYRVLPS